MNRLKIKKIHVLLAHSVFWIAVWFFFRYLFGYNSEDRAYVAWFSSFLLPLTMLVTYLMVYLLIPAYLLKRDYIRFALYSFYLFVLAAYLVALILYGFLIFLLDLNIDLMPPMSKNIVFIMILILLVTGVVSSVTILNHNFQAVARYKELQNKILATQLELREQELHHLKSQIHPHFLFNTLNTIYGLALKRSDQTPELILRLSNLLDYILYQVSKPSVSLREEILHIGEYIELEKIRFKDTLRITFSPDEIVDELEIAPMLLIPFVENAFKHGSIRDGFLRIDISLRITVDILDFTVINSFITGSEEDSGIGLENIRKRLELHYPGSYLLEQEVTDEQFSIHLSIKNLKNNQNE